MSEIVINLSDYEFDESDDKNADDYMLALQLQMQIENFSSDNNDPSQQMPSSSNKDINFEKKLLDIVSPFKSQSRQPLSQMTQNDPEWDLIDPCPDIRALFQEYDKKYFWSRLGSCIVEWSKRMTICAGIFYLREGGIIRLSEPLLKYRPRTDLIDTLLHEMIHAYLYLTHNYKDRGEHGDEFKGHAARINKLANSRITVYHSFHDEVNNCRQHVWRCDGPCRTNPPFYGYVKRSMNRAPGKNDTWWSQHESKCNGKFSKVSEPQLFKQKQEEKISKLKLKNEKKSSSENPISSSSSELKSSSKIKTLDSFFTSKASQGVASQPKQSQNEVTSKKALTFNNIIDPPKMKIAKLDNYFEQFLEKKSKSSQSDELPVICLESPKRKTSSPFSQNKFDLSKNIKPKSEDVIILDDDDDKSAKLVECPICFTKFNQNIINSHVNSHF